jgi:cyclopropane fatty-acyl-phospholipid synthase-like methyltransferase
MSEQPRQYAHAGKTEEANRLEAQGKALERMLEREIEILGLMRDMKILDAGCGTGVLCGMATLRYTS